MLRPILEFPFIKICFVPQLFPHLFSISYVLCKRNTTVLVTESAMRTLVPVRTTAILVTRGSATIPLMGIMAVTPLEGGSTPSRAPCSWRIGATYSKIIRLNRHELSLKKEAKKLSDPEGRCTKDKNCSKKVLNANQCW